MAENKHTTDQLYEMITSLKSDLKEDLGEIKDELRDVKNTVSSSIITQANHENRIKNLEETRRHSNTNLQQWLMLLITFGALIVSFISILN